MTGCNEVYGMKADYFTRIQPLLFVIRPPARKGCRRFGIEGAQQEHTFRDHYDQPPAPQGRGRWGSYLLLQNNLKNSLKKAIYWNTRWFIGLQGIPSPMQKHWHPAQRIMRLDVQGASTSAGSALSNLSSS